MNVEFKKFDYQSASDDDWNKFHEFRRQRWMEHSPDEPIVADETLQSRMRYLTSEYHFRSYALFERGEYDCIVGFLSGSYERKDSPSYEENKHVYQVGRFELLKEYRRKNIGFQMLRKLCFDAKEENRLLLVGGSSEEDGKAFCRALRAKEALSGVEKRLYLNDLDWNMVERWHKEGTSRSKGAKLEFFNNVPEDLIEDYCKVYTEVINQVPREDLDIGNYIVTPKERRKNEKNREDVGTIWITAITREENGDISGLTEIVYAPSQDFLAHQILTGVKQEYRGHGKGKWLKAAMLLKIREELPKITMINTGIATSNEPMLSINDRLGFKMHKQYFAYQIEVDKAEKHLKKYSK